MKQLLTFLTVLCCFTIKTNAQLFQNTIGKDNVAEYGESIAQAADSSYLIAGDYATVVGGETQPFIIRLKKDGTIQWSKKVNVPEQSIFTKASYAEAVKTANAAPDGYIMLITEITYFYVVRLNNAGAVVWTRQFNNADNIKPKIRPCYDNAGTLTGYIILARKYFNPNYNGVIMKIGTTGNTLWQKRITHGTAGVEYRFADIQATTDGGCIAAGNLYQSNKVSTPVLFRFSSTGTVLWRFSYTFTSSNETPPEIRGVAATFSGYAATGYLNGDNITFSTNLSGLLNWAFRYSNGSPLYQPEEGSAITADASGNLIVACLREPITSKNAAIFKLSPTGGVMFSKKFNSSSAFRDIKLTKQGTYCAVGYSGPYSDADISVVNISSSGTIKSGCQPEAFTLTASSPFTKLLGAPVFGIVNETFGNTSITATTTSIQTEQSLCGSTFDIAEGINETNDKLLVANDMAGQRVLVKWQTNETGNTMYEAVLCNNAGMPVSTIKLNANQPAYISMRSMNTGMYSILLQQNGKPIIREKVLWFK